MLFSEIVQFERAFALDSSWSSYIHGPKWHRHPRTNPSRPRKLRPRAPVMLTEGVHRGAHRGFYETESTAAIAELNELIAAGWGDTLRHGIPSDWRSRRGPATVNPRFFRSPRTAIPLTVTVPSRPSPHTSEVATQPLADYETTPQPFECIFSAGLPASFYYHQAEGGE